MKKYFLLVFVLLGAADLVYGLIKSENLSMFMGAIIVIIALTTFVRQLKEEKQKKSAPGDKTEE